MQYTQKYKSPLGNILLAADQKGLTGLWFEGQKHFASKLDPEHQEKNMPVFEQVSQWLDIYFSGKNPDFTPPLHMIGTEFQIKVWELLLKIPYGETTTYGQLARQCNTKSAQAVGGAVGRVIVGKTQFLALEFKRSCTFRASAIGLMIYSM